MAIQDSDPERRNLTVASVAFIAYYYAGGQVLNNEVRIQVVNVTFAHHQVLALMAWMLLIWFALRYWQTRKQPFTGEFASEISSSYQRDYVVRFTEKKLNSKINSDGGFIIRNITKPLKEGWGVKYTKVIKGDFNEHTGSINNFVAGGDGFLKLSVFIKARIFLFCVLTKKSFSEHAVPYLLFVIACLGPVFKHFFLQTISASTP